MKTRKKILSAFLVLAMIVTMLPMSLNVSAASVSNSKNILFSGEKVATRWQQVVTYDVVRNRGPLDPSIITKDGYFKATFSGEKDGLQMIFQSWTGGAGWAIVEPSEIKVEENNFVALFYYNDIVSKFGSDFTLLDRLYFNTSVGAITLFKLEYVDADAAVEPSPSETVKPTPSETVKPSPSETVKPTPSETVKPTPSETVKPTPSETVKPTPSQTVKPTPSETVKPTPSQTVKPTPSETVKPTPSQTVKPSPSAVIPADRINLFSGSKDIEAYKQGIQVFMKKNGGKLDGAAINEDGYFSVSYSGSRGSMNLIFQSWSGGGQWITVQPTIIKKNAYQDYTAIFNYETITKQYGTKLSVLDAIHVVTSNGAITLKSVDYTTSGVERAIEDAQPVVIKTPAPSFIPGEIAEHVCLPTEENVKVLGRTYVDAEGSRWITNTASGVEFTFTGTKATVKLATSFINDAGNMARVGIFVDGKMVTDVVMDEFEKTVDFFESDKETAVNVRILKLSEGPFCPFSIENITVMATSDIKATQEKERKIEFIGDSITCGYGVDDENISGGFKTATENGTRTYSYKTADALGADFSMFACSGFGIISGYTSGEKNTTQALPQYYESLGFSWYDYPDGNNSTKLAWDFDKFDADVVVINLGTNDASYCRNDATRKAEFEEAYVEFLKQVRKLNPNSEIVCTLGIMGQDLYPEIERAVNTYKSLTDDTKVSSFEFAVQSQNDGICVDYHPSEKTHQKAADDLTDYIQYVMGW